MDMVATIVNGQSMKLPKDCTLACLVQRLNLNPEHVAVAVNEMVIAANQFNTHLLTENDQVEIIQFVGGG